TRKRSVLDRFAVVASDLRRWWGLSSIHCREPFSLSVIPQISMKFNTRNWARLTLAFYFTVTAFAAAAIEPQILFNFQSGLGAVTGALVEGPDGNFYGTTAHGGPSGGGTIFRVTPAGVLTTLVSDQANPAAGLIVGNDNLLYG